MSSLRLAIAASMASNVMPSSLLKDADSKTSTSDSGSASDEEMENSRPVGPNQQIVNDETKKYQTPLSDVAGVLHHNSSEDLSKLENVHESVRSGQVTPPSPSTISRHIPPKRGLRIKVKFENNVWYGGTVEGFESSNGDLHIIYDDGTHEHAKFPDDDIVIESVYNPSYLPLEENSALIRPRQMNKNKRPVILESSDESGDEEQVSGKRRNVQLNHSKQQSPQPSSLDIGKSPKKEKYSPLDQSSDESGGTSGDSETEFEENLSISSHHSRTSTNKNNLEKLKVETPKEIEDLSLKLKPRKCSVQLGRCKEKESERVISAENVKVDFETALSQPTSANIGKDDPKHSESQPLPSKAHSDTADSKTSPTSKVKLSGVPAYKKDNLTKQLVVPNGDLKPQIQSDSTEKVLNVKTPQNKEDLAKTGVTKEEDKETAEDASNSLLNIRVPKDESTTRIAPSEDATTPRFDPNDFDSFDNSSLHQPEHHHRPSEHRPSLEYVFGGYDASADRPSKSDVQEFQWVQCDACTKWRRVPNSVDLDLLPEKWFCRMNKWDPNRASCNVPEDKEQDVQSPNPSARSNQVLSGGKGGHRGGRGSGSSSAMGPYHRQGSARGHSSSPAGMGRGGSGYGRTGVGVGGRTSHSRAGHSASQSASGGRPKKRVHQWVQCERQECKKWRKLPVGYNMDQLPEKWFCRMNDWDPMKASCHAPEDTDDANEEPDIFEAKPQRSRWDHSFYAGTHYNTKQGKMSYREMIFGIDGKLRVPYCEKGTNGRSLFGYNHSGQEELFYRRNPEKYCSSSVYKDPHASRKNRFEGTLLSVCRQLSLYKNKEELGMVSRNQDQRELILMSVSKTPQSTSDVYSLIKSRTYVDARLTSIQSDLSLPVVEKHLEFLVTADVLQKQVASDQTSSDNEGGREQKTIWLYCKKQDTSLS